MGRPIRILWSEEPEENAVRHVGEHGVTPEGADESSADILIAVNRAVPTRADGWCRASHTAGDSWLSFLTTNEDEDLVVPVTAFEPQCGD